MMTFEQAWKRLHDIEGDWSNHAADRGGKTMYGVTERVARAAGWTGRMEDLPYEFAVNLAKRQYWDCLRGDDIAALSGEIAYELMDTGYNMGTGVAGRFLQRALNALNRGGTDYGDIQADGVIGVMTINALAAYLRRRASNGEVVMLRALNALQGARYIEISENDPSQEAFTFGWLANRVGV